MDGLARLVFGLETGEDFSRTVRLVELSSSLPPLLSARSSPTGPESMASLARPSDTVCWGLETGLDLPGSPSGSRLVSSKGGAVPSGTSDPSVPSSTLAPSMAAPGGSKADLVLRGRPERQDGAGVGGSSPWPSGSQSEVESVPVLPCGLAGVMTRPSVEVRAGGSSPAKLTFAVKGQQGVEGLVSRPLPGFQPLVPSSGVDLLAKPLTQRDPLSLTRVVLPPGLEASAPPAVQGCSDGSFGGSGVAHVGSVGTSSGVPSTCQLEAQQQSSLTSPQFYLLHDAAPTPVLQPTGWFSAGQGAQMRSMMRSCISTSFSVPVQLLARSSSTGPVSMASLARPSDTVCQGLETGMDLPGSSSDSRLVVSEGGAVPSGSSDPSVPSLPLAPSTAAPGGAEVGLVFEVVS